MIARDAQLCEMVSRCLCIEVKMAYDELLARPEGIGALPHYGGAPQGEERSVVIGTTCLLDAL